MELSSWMRGMYLEICFLKALGPLVINYFANVSCINLVIWKKKRVIFKEERRNQVDLNKIRKVKEKRREHILKTRF